MKGDLFINSKDAWLEWGINMGEGFIDTIDTPASLKEYITNDSRVENGVRYVNIVPRVDAREMTLRFTITGKNRIDFKGKKALFLTELASGDISIVIPSLDVNTEYHLKYLGKGISYALNRSRTFCVFASKFAEPNPADRKVR